ncbi:FmdB family zinc ribbon protein [Chloroflexota bacterium]
MPLYEYECDICRYRFEMKQGFDAATTDICPQCQGRSRRVLYSTPLLFKGSGFYITDSRKDKEKTTTKDKGETVGKPEQKGK